MLTVVFIFIAHSGTGQTFFIISLFKGCSTFGQEFGFEKNTFK
jgi:hypothetical protein